MAYYIKRIIKLLLFDGYLDLYSYGDVLLAIKLKKENENVCSIQDDIDHILNHIYNLNNCILYNRWPKFTCKQEDEFSISLITNFECSPDEIKNSINELKDSWIVCHNDAESKLIEKMEENKKFINKTIIIKQHLDSEL